MSQPGSAEDRDAEATRGASGAAPHPDELTRILPGAHLLTANQPRTQPLNTAANAASARTPTPPRGDVHTTETLPGNARPGEMAARQVGRYLIQERLGRGGMATVFKAHDPGIGRDVAIKFLHATLCEDEEYRGRFLLEAKAAGGLSHPNIVTVFDVGEIEGRPYMAMELLTGEPLSELMEPGKPQPLRDVVVMGIQLANALDYAHAHGIVHRDIKPGNVVRMKGTQTIKVTDFGIAHMEATGGAEQRTRVGDVLGTPQYMSPEQTQGEKLDGRSDLFSAGIMFYQMLAGQRPFHGDSLVALALKIAKENPQPIEKLRPDLPPALRRVIERCLAKSPAKRFQTGRELADALTRVLADIDEAAREKDKRRLVPLRVKWAATMALIVAVVMALVGAFITERQYSAMLTQVTDNGASLARFIAAQNAVPALGEEWPTVDVAVQEMMKTGDFQSINVIDREGIVRASGDPALVGQPYKAPPSEVLGKRDGGITMTRFSAKGEPALGFDAPITFGGKPVGRVALGLPEKPLLHVARLSIALMIALVLVTVLAVAIAMYFVANWFAQPIKLVSEAMGEMEHGRFDHRIAEHRNDEFGLLFTAFDRMAQALQDARSGTSNVAAPAMPVATAVPAAPQGALPSAISASDGLPAAQAHSATPG
jgi:HAMP domain-containing protein